MIYFAIVVMILFFAMILEKFQNIDLKILYYIIFIFVLVFFTGLRGDIEPDYLNYLDIFNNINYNSDVDVELGFVYFNRLIHFLGGGFQWVVFLMAFITIILKVNFFFKYSKNFCFSILIYYCSVFFIYDFIAIRQALAMAIFMVSIPFLMERKFLHYTVLIFLASLIHLSAIILLPLYFILNYSFNKILLYLVLIFSTLVSVLQSDIKFVSPILNLLSLPGFASDKLDIYSKESMFAALSFRQLMLGFIFVFLLSKSDGKKTVVFLNIYLLGILLGTLLNEIPQLSYRIKAYFLWAESILVVYFIHKIFYKYSLIRIIALFILGLLYIYSLYNYLNILSERQVGYIFPYRFFFE